MDLRRCQEILTEIHDYEKIWKQDKAAKITKI